MLLVQTSPAASCGCGNSVSGDRCRATQSAPTCCLKKATKSCCVQEAKPNCCSWAKSSSCCSKSRDDHPMVGPTSCCDGRTCACGTLPAPARNPAVPIPQEHNGQERLELVTMSPTATIALVSTSPSAQRRGTDSSAQFAPATALDRCIVLSRFTC